MSENMTTPLADVKPTAPLPENTIMDYAEASGTDLTEIDRVIAEVDLEDSNSILFFGSSAQTEVTSVADEMLEGVRNKDTGTAGAALNEMVTTLRGFSLDDLDPGRVGKDHGLLALGDLLVGDALLPRRLKCVPKHQRSA